MHMNFSEWYRLVSLEPDGSKLPTRWAGVKAWAAALRNSDENLLETVRIFQGIPAKTSRDAFLAVFQKEDPAFPLRNDLEQQVLAGASLVACVQSVGDGSAGLRTAILAGAALEASSLGAGEPRLDEISGEVIRGLNAIAVKQRERKPFDSSAIDGKADAALEGMENIPTIDDWQNLQNVITPIFQALVDAVRAADVELSAAAHNIRSADEETNILWWMEGGCSRDTNRPWGELKDGAAIIAGTELADLTDCALGPRNVEALLTRVLGESKGKGEDLPLATYVNALPDDWTRERAARANDSALDLTPLTLAVAHCGKSDTASWGQYFDASSGLKSSMRLAATHVARQAYVEAVFLRALADVRSEE